MAKTISRSNVHLALGVGLFCLAGLSLTARSRLWAQVDAQIGVAAPAATVAAIDVKEPAQVQDVTPRMPQRDRWDWNKAQAEITPTGDLQWKPHPFVFEAGPTVRYIDFDGGDDSRAGDSKDAAWKHHPWDSAASGNAKAAKGGITYVFKRGVTYRGSLHPAESGTLEMPIRLTSDPAWGTGEAVICGSERVTGWKQGADNDLIPQKEKVWYADLKFAPRDLWELTKSEEERIPLARMPNWKVSDPNDIMSEWWTWENPKWWAGAGETTKVGRTVMHLGIDTKHLTEAAEYYVGAVVRSEYGIVMGTPFPSRVESYDAKQKAIGFQGIWFAASEKIIRNNRYYLEDKPQYLNEAGEFWFDKKGAGGRLYLRLSGDRDPGTAVIEAAKEINLIDSDGISNIQITGLTFRFTNDFWDLTQPAWGNKDVNGAAIRVVGSGDNIRIANCRFVDINKAVRLDANNAQSRMDHIIVADNEMRNIDHGAIEITGTAIPTPPYATLGDVKVLRNSLFMVGQRPYRQDHGHALCVNFPETMEVAGNVLSRTGGAGLFLFSGKPSGNTSDRPLSRDLVYNNKVTDALLSANDWGSIETWQGGPHYVYNNISGNPGGYWNWAYDPKKPGGARIGYAYYLDGSFKNYHFNNVGWGNSNDLTSKLCNAPAINEATYTYENTFFNNTFYKFSGGSNWSPSGGRHMFLGNAWLDISSWVFTHGRLKEDKPGEAPPAYPMSANAYFGNVFYKTSDKFAVFETSGKPYGDLASFQQAMAEYKPLAAEIGVMADKPPVVDADKHDFHPTPGSALTGHGVKVFVPWSLSRVVGEWHFRCNRSDPTVLLDNHFYMTPYFVAREDYYKTPVNNLKAVNIAAGDYTPGPLEDWTDSALKFNGRDQYATLSEQDLSAPFTYTAGKKQLTAAGMDLATPEIADGNFLMEIYFRTEAGHSGGGLVAKMGDAGYQLSINKAGGLTLMLRGGGQTTGLASGARINDGQWHHAIAQVDRSAQLATIYVDGNKSAAGAVDLPQGAALTNTADFLVGKSADGHCFAGAMAFLRISRGTLADAKTSIEELYDWEFDGPFRRDFTGREPAGKTRAAGAFEPVAP